MRSSTSPVSSDSGRAATEGSYLVRTGIARTTISVPSSRGAAADEQEAASDADPYHDALRPSRTQLDRHATYIVAAFVAGASRPA
jgi:hypothetical protein